MLALDRVAKFFGNRLVFRDVSLSVEPGSVLLVAGPNGAGKSTLLRVMAGLARPSQGAVRCDVEPGRLGYVGHHTFIYPELTALENLGFWARLYGRPADEAALVAALERVELAHAGFERAGTFSRGMAQRLSLARVFLLEPELILLDEPGTGLDRRSMAILRTEIAAARGRGAALVWVSHSVERDLELADRVLEIKGRSVAYLGPAADYEPEAVSC
jgi:heme exporter protein A